MNMRIIQNMMAGIPLTLWAFEPECRILMFMWAFGSLYKLSTPRIREICPGPLALAPGFCIGI